MKSSSSPVLISVFIVTYNHEKFIAKALDSILMQKTDFAIEVVIGEDCSTDNTRAIINEYIEKHPGLIKPLFHEKNIGPIPNVIMTLEACKGKYIALLEGDDYWTDESKLQKQVSFLEQDISYSFSSHVVTVMNSDGSTSDTQYPVGKEKNTFEDVIASHYIPTCSLVFRNILTYPHWFRDKHFLSGDMAIELMLAHHGYGFHFNEDMAIHLKHSGGVTKSDKYRLIKNRVLNKKVLFEGIDEYTNYRYKSVKRELASAYLQYAILLFKDRQISGGLFYAMKSISRDPLLILRSADNSLVVLKNLFKK